MKDRLFFKENFQCNGQFFPPVSFSSGKEWAGPLFPRGKKMTGQFFPPGKDLTSQFFPHPVSFFPHVTFFGKGLKSDICVIVELKQI